MWVMGTACNSKCVPTNFDGTDCSCSACSCMVAALALMMRLSDSFVFAL